MNQPWLTTTDWPVNAFDSNAARNGGASAASSAVPCKRCFEVLRAGSNEADFRCPTGICRAFGRCETKNEAWGRVVVRASRGGPRISLRVCPDTRGQRK